MLEHPVYPEVHVQLMLMSTCDNPSGADNQQGRPVREPSETDMPGPVSTGEDTVRTARRRVEPRRNDVAALRGGNSRHGSDVGRLGRDDLYRLYVVEKKSLAEIARPLGVSKALVGKWLRAAGIPARSIREGTILSGKYGVQSEAHRETLRRNAAIARSKITAESREKWRAKMLGREPLNKGQPMRESTRQILIAQRADPEYRRRASERMRGENSPNWKGGSKSDLDRRLDRAEWRRLRLVVYARDNWTCQDCSRKCKNTRDSKTDGKAKIQAHHIVPRRFGGGDELDNLVTLCMSCHHKRERKISA